MSDNVPPLLVLEPNVRHHSPADISYEGIREYAERILNRHQLLNANGTPDVAQLTEKLGGIIHHNVAQYTKINGAGHFVSGVATVISFRRERLNLAHNLGHYFLHYRLPQLNTAEFYRCGYENKHTEVQANVFASALLMPGELFAFKFTQLRGNEEELSAYFNTSVLAVRVRAETMSLT